jgi:hypothetical protein
MADSIAWVLAKHTKVVIQEARYFSLLADEVTAIGGESWLSIHLYICLDFKRVIILLALVGLVDGNGTDVLRETMYSQLCFYTGLGKNQGEKLVYFGADGMSIFQGCRNGVTVQLQEHAAPFMFGVHCMAHCTNLVVQHLSDLPLVAKLESLCQALYAYFSHSSKRLLEFQKLVEMVETEGLRILQNVSTRWIFLLEPLKRIMKEYKTLIVKMCKNATVKEPELIGKQAAGKESTSHNLDLLCDVGTLLGLPCLLPLWEFINSLMKFAQSNHVSIGDYVAAIKICQAEFIIFV